MPVFVNLTCSREKQVFILADTLCRTQRISFTELFPYRTDGLCRCGCGKPLPPRRPVWYSRYHANMAVNRWRITIGDPQAIRNALWARDKGVCAICGNLVLKWKYKRGRRLYKRPVWDAHHTKPVVLGGGFCKLEDYQTLCKPCHRRETKKLRKQLAKTGKKAPDVALRVR